MNNSSLYYKKTFYKQFINDLQNCKKEVIIESPFISTSRMRVLYPILIIKGINIYIITRNPLEHNGKYALESEIKIQRFENAGIQVLLCRGNFKHFI